MDPQKQEAFWQLWQERVEDLLTSDSRARNAVRIYLTFSPTTSQLIAECVVRRQPIPNDQLTEEQLRGLFTLFYDCHGSLTPDLDHDMRGERLVMESLIFRDGLTIRGFKHVLLHDTSAERDEAIEKWRTDGGTPDALSTVEGRKNFFWYIWIHRMLTRLKTTEALFLTENERRYIAETVCARMPLKPVRDRTLPSTYGLTCDDAFKGVCVGTHRINRYDLQAAFLPEVLDLSD